MNLANEIALSLSQFIAFAAVGFLIIGVIAIKVIALFVLNHNRKITDAKDNALISVEIEQLRKQFVVAQAERAKAEIETNANFCNLTYEQQLLEHRNGHTIEVEEVMESKSFIERNPKKTLMIATLLFSGVPTVVTVVAIKAINLGPA